MSGHYGDLSKQQEEALAEFKAKAAPLPGKPFDDDRYYLRLLRARKFNVKKAFTMLKNHLDMRKRFGADTIVQDWTPPEVLQKCFPGGFFGEDRDGHPVWYDNIGRLDFRGLHRSCRKEDVLKLKCLHQELGTLKLKEFSEKKGRPIETMTIMVDFEGLSLQKHYYWPGIEMVKEVLAMGESGDPETVKRTIIVRAPSFFPMCYNVVKHVLDEKTRQKVQVLGSNWKEELQKYISPDQLPQVYGGTRCEPDEWCSDHINPGCDVPPEFYLTNQTETERQEMDKVVVGSRSSHKIRLEVTEVDSTIKWEVVSSGYDLGFGVYTKTDGKNGKTVKTELVPVTRRDCHIVPEVGTHICKVTGTYIVKFDNSYSWARSKEVFFSVKLLPPNEEPHPPSAQAANEDEEKFLDCDKNEASIGAEPRSTEIEPPITDSVATDTSNNISSPDTEKVLETPTSDTTT